MKRKRFSVEQVIAMLKQADLVECSPNIGPWSLLGFPQPEEDRHEEEAIHRITDRPDFAGCGDDHH